MTTKRFFGLTGLCCVALGLPACSNTPAPKPEPTWEQAAANPLIPANYKAAEALLAQANPVLTNTQPLIIATVVNIDNLDQSSTLGRLISEHVSARFTKAGYRMIELKYRNSVYVKRSQGELMLTREIKDLAQSHDAQAVIVGTYGQSDEFVFVNLKVIQPATNIVLAVQDYVLPLDNSTKALLRSR
ncbi:FlgO family outer membrane protein [Sulfuricystis multivorans]|uniref:FlgO family outer membrane protein n=1 Tax=Sulfuricystis multivorans TaxID=2211108 RepID=UPI001559B862|nr:FlgO family outer membrane protein [Sulfuricystis multivorans]